MCGQRPLGPSVRRSMQHAARPSHGRTRRMAVPVAFCFHAAIFVITAPTLSAAASLASIHSARSMASGDRARNGPFAVADMASSVAAGRPVTYSDESTEDADSTGNWSSVTDSSVDDLKDQVSAGVSAFSNTLQGKVPCSCDCCQVVSRAPNEVVQLSSNLSVSHKCDYLAPPQGDSTQSQCPSTCLDQSGNTVITSETSGDLDYRRYCAYQCLPSTNEVGSDCVMLTAAQMEAATEDNGNGKVLNEAADATFEDNVGPLSSGPAEAVAAPTASAGEAALAAAESEPRQTVDQAVEQEAQAEAAAAQNKVQVVYDLRALMAQRLRAETGASMAHGSVATERVRVNQYLIERAASLTKKSANNAAPLQAGIEDGRSYAVANATNAIEAENEATRAASKAESFVGEALKEARKLAKEEIEVKAAPCAKVQAEALAIAKGMDKPDKWEKVLAARAADPYMQAVSMAVQRVSEYKALADSLVDQAGAAQISADRIAPHMNALEATGDILGAKIERVKIKNLLARSRALQSQAKKYWQMADDARKTVPEWQTAAGKAAQYAAFQFKNPPK
mmetsp:Transcript_47540/g.84190  ORF Transcript_47540/g.84190 Transcript_47540/m.84190 type:complete len:565 (-) Transcript_47540:70-1764(-)